MTTNLYFPSDGSDPSRIGFEDVTPEWFETLGGKPPMVSVNVSHEDGDFVLVMGVDPIEPINRRAQAALVFLANLHIICFGPVVIMGLGDHDAEYVLEAA